MKKENLELLESERAILQKIWELEPCAAPMVQKELQGEKGWAYTTVKTMMGRMVKKGLLKTEKMRNLYFTAQWLPSPRLAKAKSPERLKGPLTELFTPLMQFLIENDQLSKEAYSHLEKLIESRLTKIILIKLQKNVTF